MKYIKILGLAAIAAMALTAFVGAGTASAAKTVLCKANETPCSPANTYAAKTKIVAGLKAGTNAKLKTEGGFVNPTVECTTSAVEGETSEIEGEPLKGKITVLSFGGCSAAGFGKCTATAKNLPYNAAITTDPKSEPETMGDGILTVTSGGTGNPGAEVVCEKIAAPCVYSAVSFALTIKGGNPAEVIASALPLSGGVFPCPPKATWTATYTITSPKPLFVI